MRSFGRFSDRFLLTGNPQSRYHTRLSPFSSSFQQLNFQSAVESPRHGAIRTLLDCANAIGVCWGPPFARRR